MTSIIKVDNLQNQCGANIISESANVITIGASGDTVTLAAGASQSGFGRSGSVNWDTTAKTTGFTAVSGNGYFCNTTSSAFTVTLPLSPSAGAIVAIADYNGTAGTNSITVGRNSSNINGSATNFTISINYAAISFVYVDSTAGWRSVDTSDIIGVSNQYVAATGGTITTCGDYKIHTFTGPGTFTVTSAGTPVGSDTVDYLVVAGGGGGGGRHGGGGGGGGFRESKATGAPWTASPLASSTSIPVSATAYPITVGSGGAGGIYAPGLLSGVQGNNSIFSTITSAGGGGGVSAAQTASQPLQLDGGSGGGGALCGMTNFPSRSPREVGGTGNTPPVAPSQGNTGGTGGSGPPYAGAGGGGATAVGANGNPIGGAGGAGATTSISGSPTAYAGGGGGGGYVTAGGAGGTGGGGAGGPQGVVGTAGTINTGGGGGGTGDQQPGSPSATAPQVGGAGGSGIVVIRYKFQ